MGDGSSVLLRRRLVGHLRRQGLLHDPRIVQAFLDVPREVFLPEVRAREGLAAVYRDDAIVTRRDPRTGAALSSSSQPAIMAIMLEMLRPQHGQRVMEIGTGSGYNAALLDLLVGRHGFVVSMDIDVATVRAAAVALRSLSSRVHLVVGDGVSGLPGIREARTAVDAMVVTASTALIPRPWHDQLAHRGRLVVPLRLSHDLERAHAVAGFDKVAGGFDSFKVTPGGFMPLRRRDGSTFGEPARGPGPRGPAPMPGATGTAPGPPLAPPWAAACQQASSSSQISRQEMDRLVIAVRYGAEPAAGRWQLHRGDQWIGIDVAPPPSTRWHR